MSPPSSSSRSSSPETPDSDFVEGSASNVLELPSWYTIVDSDQTIYSPSNWDTNTSFLMSRDKSEDRDMLHLDDLIEQDAYEDSPSKLPANILPISPLIAAMHQSALSQYTPPEFLVSPSLQTTATTPVHTKPIPPPAAVPRKAQILPTHHKVVRPPKDSCYNLPIIFPTIPEGGTKSRVETQIRVTVDLADTSSSSDPSRYDRVGSWKWLKLPFGTATKRRTRKQGRIMATPEDTLDLSITVTCASPPHNRVLSCSSCQSREAKRVAKKIAARVRPAQSEVQNEVDLSCGSSNSAQHEDTTSIIQFNCAEVVDFSTGSAILPLRITCYCRHHREKQGFNVHFTMMDNLGRIVGAGSTRPIMITDDHKTATTNTKQLSDFPATYNGMELEWSPPNIKHPENGAPSKRKPESASKKRTKPYDSSSKPSRVPSRENSVSATSSPGSTDAFFSPFTRSPTPPSSFATTTESDVPSPKYHSPEPESSAESLVMPIDMDSFDLPMMAHNSLSDMVSTSSAMIPAHPHPIPLMFMDPGQIAQPPVTYPTIHRLIPNSGPTHGGIEVTILGVNFHASLQLTCVFGDVKASSTQRWSDNALVCVLPPRAIAGVVAVWFEGFQPIAEAHLASPTSLFTYSDESDRALMELALQVVGLKMTGKIEDAKNVAMRIVGSSGHSEGQSSGSRSTASAMQLANSAMRDLRPLLMIRAGENSEFESLLVDFLSILDTPMDDVTSNSAAISHQTSTGQTLLHLAAFVGFRSLVGFLVNHRIDLDARDKNGFTALHFAAFSKSKECARIIVEHGADREIVNNQGKTAEEIGEIGFFEGMFESVIVQSEDEEAQWGDGEDDASDVVVRKSQARKGRHRSNHRRRMNGENNVKQGERDVVPLRPPVPDEKAALELNEKHAATFLDLIQRTLAQLPGPLQNLPQLPHIPGMPWDALPQLPVFPIFIPPPLWPNFRGKDREQIEDGPIRPAGAAKFAMEWRTAWEKWLNSGAVAEPDVPPPMYTENATDVSMPEDSAASSATAQALVDQSEHDLPVAESSSHARRRVGYVEAPIPAQVIESYGYQRQEQKKKQDRMLFWFWIPVLLVSLLWACLHGLTFTIRTVRTILPIKAAIRQ